MKFEKLVKCKQLAEFNLKTLCEKVSQKIKYLTIFRNIFKQQFMGLNVWYFHQNLEVNLRDSVEVYRGSAGGLKT